MSLFSVMVLHYLFISLLIRDNWGESNISGEENFSKTFPDPPLEV